MSEMINNEVKILKAKYEYNYLEGVKKLVKMDFNESSDLFNKAATNLIKLSDLVDDKFKDKYLTKAFELKQIALDIKNKETEEDSSESFTYEEPKNNISFDDVAGLEDVKEEVFRKAIYPIKYKEIYARFNKKSDGGILLYGVPGTGKTLIAQAIANEVNAHFIPIKCSDLLDKYLGESEKNIANLFKEARKYPLSIIFFDEFEALGASRGKENNGTINRVVPQLLAEMQGFNTLNDDSNKVIVIAATNRPWDIDSAFMRPGRFTARIEVRLPDLDARRQIISKSFEGIDLDEDANLDMLAKNTEGYSAADVDNVCECIKEFPIDRLITTSEGGLIKNSDILEALEKVGTSVRRKDVLDIKRFTEENCQTTNNI